MNDAWNQFEKTGLPVWYLRYKAVDRQAQAAEDGAELGAEGVGPIPRKR